MKAGKPVSVATSRPYGCAVKYAGQLRRRPVAEVAPPNRDLRPMVRRSPCGSIRPWTDHLRHQHHWIFCVAALVVWLALGWPVLEALVDRRGDPRRARVAAVARPVRGLRSGGPGRDGPEAAAGACNGPCWASSLPRSWRWRSSSIGRGCRCSSSSSRGRRRWRPRRQGAGLGRRSRRWRSSPRSRRRSNPDLCWVHGMSFGAAAVLVLFTAQGAAAGGGNGARLARPASCGRRKPIIANTVRDAERLRISRELHDAWGHELTALGLQLEIASHVDRARPGQRSCDAGERPGPRPARQGARCRRHPARGRTLRPEGRAGGAGAKRARPGHPCRHLPRRAGRPRPGPRLDALRAGSGHQRHQACRRRRTCGFR